VRNKTFNDIKHKIARQFRKAKEQGKDYFEWGITDESDLDYIRRYYNAEPAKYQVKCIFRCGFNIRNCKSNIVKQLYRRKGTAVVLRLSPSQIAECHNAGLEVRPIVYRISRRSNEEHADRGRRSGRRNIGKARNHRR
jgi:hypothetical protein